MFTSSYAEQEAPPALESAAPPAHEVVMPAIAGAAGVLVDVIDSGAGSEFSRPEQAIRPHGPIANALQGRMLGRAQAVDTAGDAATSAANPVLNQRVGNGS